MTVSDDALQAVRAHPAGMTDAELAKLLERNHPRINQVCHRLAREGLIRRGSSRRDIVNMTSGDAPSPRASTAHRAASTGPQQERVWEGLIPSHVVAYLASNGWSIIRVADTAQRERRADIIAKRAGRRLLVEVKGWPGGPYACGERVGQPMSTQPTLQATQWFTDALTSLIRRGVPFCQQAPPARQRHTVRCRPWCRAASPVRHEWASARRSGPPDR